MAITSEVEPRLGIAVVDPQDVESDQDARRRLASVFRNLFWWTALLITLIILDDLIFGPIAWSLAQISPWLAAGVAFTAMWGLSYWLVLASLRPEHGRVARVLLSRLQLQRKNPEIRAREDSLKKRLTSVAVAVPMSLLFGGVVTSLWLYRRDVVDRRNVTRVALYLTALYACEFVLLHAVGGGLLLSEVRDAF